MRTLERQQVDLLLREHTFARLSGETPTPLLTAHRIVDLTFNQDLNEPKKLDVMATLESPDGSVETIRGAGSSDQLAAIVQQLTAEILARCNDASRSPSFKSHDEAARLMTALRWLHDHRAWGREPAMLNLAEAAYALGERSDDVTSFRIQPLLNRARELEETDSQRSLEAFEEAASRVLANRLAEERYYRFHEGQPLGIAAVDTLCDHLESWNHVNITQEDAAQIEIIRRWIRQLRLSMHVHPAWAEASVFDSPLDDAWLWCDTPAEAIDYFRRVLITGPHVPQGDVRQRWLQHFNARLPNRRGESEADLKTMSEAFLEELSLATPEGRLVAWKQRLLAAGFDEAREKLDREFEQVVWDMRDDFANGKVDMAYLFVPHKGPSQAKLDFKYRMLVDFASREDCDRGAISEAHRTYTYNNVKHQRTPGQSRELHAALSKALGNPKLQSMRTAFKSTLRELEQECPDLPRADNPVLPPKVAAPVERTEQISPLRVHRLTWPKLTPDSTEPPGLDLLEAHRTGVWHDGLFYSVAQADNDWVVMSLDVETSAATLLPIPFPDGVSQPHQMHLAVTERAFYITLDHRQQDHDNGLYRYDREAGQWRVYKSVYGVLDPQFREGGMIEIGDDLYLPFYDSKDDKVLGPNSGLARVDLKNDRMRLIVSRHRTTGESPLDTAEQRMIHSLIPGPDGTLFIKAGIFRSGSMPFDNVGYAYSPADDSWRPITPEDYRQAEINDPRVFPGTAFGDTLWNWPDADRPQHWSNQRSGAPDYAIPGIDYGDAKTGRIVWIPLDFDVDLNQYRRLAQTGHTGDAPSNDANDLEQIHRDVFAWQSTPKGVLLTARFNTPIWWFIPADEARQAAYARSQVPAVAPSFLQPLQARSTKFGDEARIEVATTTGNWHPVTTALWNDRDPQVLPDDRILFLSNRHDNHEVYLLNPATGKFTNLSNTWADESSPCVSPDSKKIACLSHSFEQRQLLVIDIATGDRRLFALPDGKIDSLRWADGARVEFTINSESSSLDTTRQTGNTYPRNRPTH